MSEMTDEEYKKQPDWRLDADYLRALDALDPYEIDTGLGGTLRGSMEEVCEEINTLALYSGQDAAVEAKKLCKRVIESMVIDWHPIHGNSGRPAIRRR